MGWKGAMDISTGPQSHPVLSFSRHNITSIGKMSVISCSVKIRGLLLWTIYACPYVHSSSSLSTFCVILHSLVVCICVCVCTAKTKY